MQVLTERDSAFGVCVEWNSSERFPPCSIRDLFTSYLDLNTPVAQDVLMYLADQCKDEGDRTAMMLLAKVRSGKFEK